MLSDILEQNAAEDITVFVVWFAVLGPDSSSEVDTSLLDDSRAVHYWDSDRDIPDFLTARAEQLGLDEVELLWDAYLLFAPGAYWDDIPSPLTGFGAPVVSEVDQLAIELQDLWSQA